MNARSGVLANMLLSVIEAYSNDHWVTLWSAVTAIATSVAALAAIVAGVYAARAYRKELESLQQLKLEAQARAERDRRAQAALVTAWMPNARTIVIRNASSALIYSVRTWVHPRDWHPIKMRWWTLAPPSDTSSREWSIRSTQYEPPVVEWENDRRSKNQTIPSMKVELTFDDAAGMWWRRTAEGSLVEITEPDAPHSADGNDLSVEDFQPADDESSSA